MNDATVCDAIGVALGGFFSCQAVGPRTRVRTPFLLPDGDGIDVYVRGQDRDLVVSDLGETVRWLRMQMVSDRRTKRQEVLLQDACLTHGLELFRGMLLARCQRPEELAATVLRVAQGCMRVADLWYTLRFRSSESLSDEVADLLTDRKVAFDRRQALPGRSSRVWWPDFHTRTEKASALVCVLSTGSRAAAKGRVNDVVAAWHDLSHLRLGPSAMRFVSLVDDTLDVWGDEDLRLVSEGLSTLALWSKPDEFIDLLAVTGSAHP